MKNFVLLLLLVINLTLLNACTDAQPLPQNPPANPSPTNPGTNNPPPGSSANPPTNQPTNPPTTPPTNPPTTPPTTPPETPSIITLTFSTPSSADFKLERVEGATNVGQIGGLDPEITLEVGKRYKIVNPLGSVHPFALTASTSWGVSYLLSQGGLGSFAADTEVKYEKNTDGFTFTLTQQLAAQLKSYICASHPGMLGFIKVTGLNP